MTDSIKYPSFPIPPFLDELYDGVAVAEPDPWRLTYVNNALVQIVGKDAETLRGERLENLVIPKLRSDALTHADQAWLGYGGGTEFVTELITSGHSTVLVEMRICRTHFLAAPVLGVIVRVANNAETSEKTLDERRDPLTGLPDRAFLLSRLEALMHGERRADRKFAVLFVDLDNFKQVNDEYGHLIGDRVLHEVGHRLTGCVREGDSVVRFGGDEFVVLLERVSGQSEIEPVIERIHRALAEPVAIPEGTFTLSLSIGAAEASPEHQSPEDLLREADRAMYAAKRVRG